MVRRIDVQPPAGEPEPSTNLTLLYSLWQLTELASPRDRWIWLLLEACHSPGRLMMRSARTPFGGAQRAVIVKHLPDGPPRWFWISRHTAGQGAPMARELDDVMPEPLASLTDLFAGTLVDVDGDYELSFLVTLPKGEVPHV